MVLPDELILERYRSFAGRVSLPLRPITLVYGANNAGKSALLRALAFLGAAVAEDGPPELYLPKAAFRDTNFSKVAWRGEAGDYRWMFGLRWPDSSVREVLYTLNSASDKQPWVRSMELVRADERWLAREGESGALLDPTASTPIPLHGLVPDSPGLADLRSQLLELRGKVRWLSAVRAPAPAVIPRGTTILPTSSDGAAAYQIVAEAADMRDQVARYYEPLVPPRTLEVHEALPSGRYLTMSPASQPGWRVELHDTGEGMTQVMPVLAFAEQTARDGGILAVEEPESHLHPDAQRLLARHLCKLASPTARFILETHSRVFLLAVQLQVARGELAADAVRIVWVGQAPGGRSDITVIPLRPSGRPGDGWPQSALAEDLQLARELTRRHAPKPGEDE